MKGKTRKLSKENDGNIFMTQETGKDFSHKTETKTLTMKKRMNKSSHADSLLIKRRYKQNLEHHLIDLEETVTTRIADKD